VELKLGDYKPRGFVTSDKVMIHDLRPNANEKWCKGTVTRVLGPLNYQVLVDGHTRQAHIDNPLSCRDSAEQSDYTTPPQPSVTSPEMEADDIIVPLTPLKLVLLVPHNRN